MNRRTFLEVAGLGAAALLVPGVRPPGAIAGPFQQEETASFPIPADKKLDPAWIRSLFERGGPQVYTAAAKELDKIGMPVGGVCTGQVYLGGDGRLWHWDVLNLPAPAEWRSSAGPHYKDPATPASPFEQGFAVRVTAEGRTQLRALDRSGFTDIRFRGQYPIGFVDYRDPACPVAVNLEAFSPFVPLSEDDSGVPGTLMIFTLTNSGAAPAEVDLRGWLENAASLRSRTRTATLLSNHVRAESGLSVLECSAQSPPPEPVRSPPRADILFEDFEKPTYDGWTVEGTAFGPGPVEKAKMPAYQGDVNARGERLVNTHNTRNGEDVVKADVHQGTLTSRRFTIERDYVSFLIGGGNHPGKTGLNLVVGGKVVRSATGRNDNRMRFEDFDVRDLAGQEAFIQIIDQVSGGWGQIGADEIVFTDTPRGEPFVLDAQPDHGTLALAVLRGPGEEVATAQIDRGTLPEAAFAGEPTAEGTLLVRPAENARLIGAVGRRLTLGPGEAAVVAFAVGWHFDGLWWDSLSFIPEVRSLRRHYGTRFKSAAEVLRFLAWRFDDLTATTRLWHATWYDSTLPYWFLDRTLATVSTLATSTCLRLSNGRFYGWEGNYCCAGTCTHVWQYAQAVARMFPRLERSVREQVDFGLAFHEDTGIIDYRAEAARELAVDGQAGTILRAYREHQMAPDGRFLQKVWPRVKRALEALIARDQKADGILDGAQYNTLDTAWYGEITWISSLYLAAVRAGEAMARERSDQEFAERCRAIAEQGRRNLVERLFNGEYFIHVVDPAHPEANSTGTGCHADQLLGQSWAHQVGLPRIVPLEPSRQALRSLWKYCFTPDIGPYRERFDKVLKGGRWFAMPGEGGLLLCTWPKGGAENAPGKGRDAWAAGYFNECWTGFEYPVAAHMIFEGLVQEGLAITRMLHDRHHARRRNPWNEVECGDHYARAMSGFGVFLAACGYESHGPQGHLGFAPRLTPERFRAAFTAAEGWGSFEQVREAGGQRERIELRWGRVRLRTLAFEVAEGTTPSAVVVRAGDRDVPATFEVDGRRVQIVLGEDVVLGPGTALDVRIS